MTRQTDSAAEVTAAQVARLAGVGRAAVSNWRRRHTDFPEPVGGTPASPTFRLTDVESWLRATGKLNALAAEDRLWQELRALTDERRLVDTLADLAAFLAFLQDKPARWRPLARGTDTDLAGRLPDAVAFWAESVGMPGGRAFAAGLQAGQVPFWRSVADAAGTQGPEIVFEELHGRYVDSAGRSTGVTPLDLAAMITGMVGGIPEGVVFDPACGSGNLLRAFQRRLGAGAHLAGQELDPALARIAAYRLDWSGQHGPATTIRQGDSLRDDQFPLPPAGEPDAGAALVVCDPPFGDRNWGHEDLAYDRRWEFDLPTRADSELAWVQHCYAHLRPGGTAIVVLPPGVASRRSGRRVRKEMLRRGALRQVVALPTGVAGGHSLGPHLWILSRPGDGRSPANSVRMVDGTRFDRERLRQIEGDWWHEFRDEPGVTADVPLIELLDDDVDLSPGRHVQRTPDHLPAEHARALAALEPLLAGVAQRRDRKS
ncbi:N-6 DNA methylase, partial [Micromonospora zhanjiangensis]